MTLELFFENDTNNDGVVDHYDNLTSDHLQYLYDTCDFDGSGKINYSEACGCI
jgi:hypothetical protein